MVIGQAKNTKTLVEQLAFGMSRGKFGAEILNDLNCVKEHA
jgi:hypothetical protein